MRGELLVINPFDELLRVCESSLDMRPEFRKAIANAHRYHHNPSLLDCQQQAFLLSAALKLMNNADYQRDAALMIGAAATLLIDGLCVTFGDGNEN